MGHRERIITVDISCDRCDGGPRCHDCNVILDQAVAATLADGIDPRHVNIKDR